MEKWLDGAPGPGAAGLDGAPGCETAQPADPRGRDGERPSPAARPGSDTRAWKDIEPGLHTEPYVFVTVPEPPPGLEPFAVIREDEGTTLVVTRDQADRAGLRYDYTAARVTLKINSSLSAIGLTAAVSRVLADAGISCNVIAGFAHDHLFVDWDRGPEAASLLRRL